MGELRDLLGREARRVAAKPDAIDGVVRRAERRHRSRRVVAGATAFAVVIGVGLGAWTLLGDPAGKTPPGDSPTAPPTLVTGGDPETVAKEYAMSQFGWTEVYFDESLDGDFGGLRELRLYVSSCDTLANEGCEGGSLEGGGDAEALLLLENSGDSWTVVDRWGPIGMELGSRPTFGRIPGGGRECPHGPFADVPDQLVRDTAESYLEFANGAPAPEVDLLWNGLVPEVRTQFQHYELFAYQLQAAELGPYGEWNIDSVGPDYPGDLQDAERCGVRDAITAVSVSFPLSSETQPVALLFVETPDGPWFWSVRQA